MVQNYIQLVLIILLKCGIQKEIKLLQLLMQIINLNLNIIQHTQPVSSVNFVSNTTRGPFLLTGSWDKSIKYNDLRTKESVKKFNTPVKIYDVDYMHPYAVAITSSRNIYIYKHIGSTFDEHRKVESTMKVQVFKCYKIKYI